MSKKDHNEAIQAAIKAIRKPVSRKDMPDQYGIDDYRDFFIARLKELLK